MTALSVIALVVSLLAVPWAAWISKLVIAIHRSTLGVSIRLDTLEAANKDHEQRIRSLERQ